MKFLKDRKAQGAFEYILLLAGVLLIVVLAIIILRGSVLGNANTQIQEGTEQVARQANPCGQVVEATHTALYSQVGGGTACCDPTDVTVNTCLQTTNPDCDGTAGAPLVALTACTGAAATNCVCEPVSLIGPG